MHNCNCAWSPSTKAEFDNLLIDLQLLYIFMVKQPGKPFLLIDNPRTLPVTQLNVPVANLLKFILGSKAERYKAKKKTH